MMLIALLRALRAHEREMYFISFLPSLLLLLLLLLLSGCGDDKEKRIEAIDTAKIYLTHKQCSNAITALDEAGRDSRDARYMQTLASAYACRASYSTIVFYGTNLPKLAVTTANPLGSLTTFTTSVMTDPSDPQYVDLLNAITLLMYAGEVTLPTVAARAGVFPATEANDLNIQMLYMILAQMGKYLFYYGNADPTTGTKGAGAISNGNPNGFTNGCFYDYNPSNPILNAAIAAARASGELGRCTSTATGHSKLAAIPNANTVKRMCQGVILFNTFVDLVLNISLPVDSGALADLSATFATVCSSGAYSAYIGDLCNLKSQSSCETDYANQPESDKLEAYFFVVFENLFK